MSQDKDNLPARVADGFDENGDSDRLIQGSLIRCVDGHWSVPRDGLAIPPGTQLLVLATTSVVQRWQDQQPIETILKKSGEPLPDVDELNAQIPKDEWEEGLDGQPRPPWQRQEIVYFLDQSTAEKFTFASGTIGARIAVSDLRERVRWMRHLRGEDVLPIVEPSSKPMKTRFGQKLRPEFKIVCWVELGVGLTRDAPAQIEPPAKSATIDNEEHDDDEESIREHRFRLRRRTHKSRGLRPVKPTTIDEEMDDEIPF
jgi:hypothetical protein